MSDTFCVLPWIHLSTQPAGNVVLCCEADHTGLKSASHCLTDRSSWDGKPYFMNTNRHQLHSIANSESFRIVRQQMLHGAIPPVCEGCHKAEEAGLQSKRLRENNKYKTFTHTDALNSTTVEGFISPAYKFVELRLGNLCNAKCITCNPLSSTKWRSDYKALAEDFDYVKERYNDMEAESFNTWHGANTFELNWPENAEFWKSLANHTATLEDLYINGGEPTLIKQHWVYLAGLVHDGRAKDINLTYNINMTNLPASAVALWKHFKSVTIGCSVDAVGDRNHYIRYPIKWDDVMTNYAALKEGNINTSITVTVSAYNFFYLHELFDLPEFKHEHFYMNFVTDPDYMSLASIPETDRNAYLESKPFTSDNIWAHRAWDTLTQKSNSTPYSSKLRQQLTEVTSKLDSLRGNSMQQALPALHNILTNQIDITNE